MSYCKSCGAYIPDGEKECFACGARTAGEKTSRSPEREAARESAAKAAAEKAASARVTGASAQTEKKSEYSSDSRTAAAGRRGADRYYSSERRGADSAAGKSAGPEKYSREYSEDADENRSFGILCYLGPLLLVPLLLRPDSSFLRYHCNQGLVLFLFCLACSIFSVIPGIGWMIGVAGWVIGLTGLLRGIKNVQAGKRSPLPYIGGITILK